MSVNISINLDNNVDIKLVANNLKIISCPGVWLCSNGFLDISVKCLGQFFKSTMIEPKFPIFCYQRFHMERYFDEVSCYHELEQILKKEKFEISLWQSGRRLAFYNGRVIDILSSNDIHILMKTSHSFPGIIAPKLQLSSNGFISDNTKRSSSTYELQTNQSIRQLYNISRCSNSSSGISDLSNSSSSEELSFERKIQKEKRRNSAKKSLPFFDSDANSLKSLSLHSSENNFVTLSQSLERRNSEKCDHNGIEGCEICILYRNTFRS